MNFATIEQGFKERLNFLGLTPLKNHSFAVLIEGEVVGGFNYIDEINARVRVREVVEGCYRGVHRFPRKAESNIVRLGRGMTTSRTMWLWFNSVRNWTRGQGDYRKNVTVIALQWFKDTLPYELWTFELTKAFPIGWQSSKFDASESRIAVEEVRLAYEAMNVQPSVFDGLGGDILGIISQ